MGFTTSRKTAAAALAGAVLLGGGIAAVAPAAAEDSAQFAATNWKKVWKNDLQQYADKRYYTKKKSDKKYATKTTLGNYYTKAQTDATYATKALTYSKADSDAKYAYYTKAQADAKYAPYPSLIRGTIVPACAPVRPASTLRSRSGVTLSAAPTAHYIPLGGAPCRPAARAPPAAPNAACGHLCIFEACQRRHSGIVNRTHAATRLGAVGTTAFGVTATRATRRRALPAARIGGFVSAAHRRRQALAMRPSSRCAGRSTAGSAERPRSVARR